MNVFVTLYAAYISSLFSDTGCLPSASSLLSLWLSSVLSRLRNFAMRYVNRSTREHLATYDFVLPILIAIAPLVL